MINQNRRGPHRSERFGLRLRQIRRSANLSRRDVARFLGMESSYITLMERGLIPSSSMMRRIYSLFPDPDLAQESVHLPFSIPRGFLDSLSFQLDSTLVQAINEMRASGLGAEAQKKLLRQVGAHVVFHRRRS